MSPDSDRRLRIGHSPDPDDAFMFYPLTQAKIDTEGLEFTDVLRDIETLNRMALEGAANRGGGLWERNRRLNPLGSILEILCFFDMLTLEKEM